MISRFSVKKPYTVIVGILLVIALGVIAFINMTTDLLPSMDLPYVIVYTTYTGATPESVESDVTRPLEAAFATLTDVKNVSSTSSENLSLVVMEFEAGADMNTAMIEINSDVEQIRGGWDDDIGTPVIMKLNPDMLPVMTTTVSLEDADLLELSDYVEDELVSRYEAVDGVARVTASGVMTQQVDITIEQNRIDVINNAILREIDDELADVELELRDAQEQLSSGKSQLASARRKAYAQIDEAIQAIDDGQDQLPQAIQALTEQREELAQQRALAEGMLTRLLALQAADDAERERILAVGAQVQQLSAQLAQAQAALDAAEGQAGNAESQLAAAQESLQDELALKQRLEAYIQGLAQGNRDELEKTAEELRSALKEGEEQYSSLRSQYTEADAERTAAKAEMDSIAAQLAAMMGGNAAPSAEATAEPSESPSADPTEGATSEPSDDPTEGATSGPAVEPTGNPTDNPSGNPTGNPGDDSGEPSAGDPTGEPSTGGSSTPEGGETATPDSDPTTPNPEGDATEAPESDAPEATKAAESPSEAPKAPESNDAGEAESEATKAPESDKPSEAGSGSSDAVETPKPASNAQSEPQESEAVKAPESNKPSEAGSGSSDAVETPKPAGNAQSEPQESEATKAPESNKPSEAGSGSSDAVETPKPASSAQVASPQSEANQPAQAAADEQQTATIHSAMTPAPTRADAASEQSDATDAAPEANAVPEASSSDQSESSNDVSTASAAPEADNAKRGEASEDASSANASPEANDSEQGKPIGEVSAASAAFEANASPEANDTAPSDEGANAALNAPDEVKASSAPAAANAAESTPKPAPAAPEATVKPAPAAPEATAKPVSAASAPAAKAEPAQSESLASRLFGGAAMAEEEHTLEELQAMYAEAQARYKAADAKANGLQARLDDLRETQNERQDALDDAEEALRLMDAGETPSAQLEQAQTQLADCEARIDALNARIEELQGQLQGGDREALAAQVAQLQQQLTALMMSDDYAAYMMLTSDKDIDTQIAEAQAGIAALDAADAQLAEMLDKLNKGIIPGGMIEGIDQDTNLRDARNQLIAARSKAAGAFAEAAAKLADAEDELAEAWKEFTDNRDEALENAGIDGIITTTTVSQILGSQNLDLPAGYVSNADDRYLVSVGTEFASIEELRNVKLFSLGMETVDDVRLFDVAKVEISDNSEDLFTFVNGENGIMLSFEKQSTASTAEVAENISAENEKLMAENGRLHITEMMNQGDYINLIVDSVLDNLVYGGALAILILLLFLLDWRPTLIVAISIPASVVVAFVCMYFTGITLNVMSLSGLALGVGMLVDNSIVSIENIYRLRDEEHLPILTASIQGVNQVAGALFASTLTTICVFLPVVFVEGMARDLFTDMGLTIAFSLLASLLVAMTLVPTASATLFKNRKEKPHRIFSAFQRAYVKLLSGALRVKPLVLLAAVALLVYSGYRVMDMGISFMPSVNSEQMSASLSFEDPDMPDSEREAAAISIMEEMQQVQGVKDVSLTGSSGLSLMSSGSGYTYYMLVDPESGRKNTEIAAEMQDRARAYADGERAVFSAQASTMDFSVFAGSGITVDIACDDIQTLRDVSKDVAAICAQVDGAENIDDGSEEAEPKLAIVVDKELASDNSLSVAQVYQYVAQRLYGATQLTNATLDGREYTLYVNEDKNIDITPDELADMEIEVEGTTETHFVRIGDIAEILDGESLSSISRDNQQRVTSVSFDVADGYSANLVSRDLEAKLAEYQPPEGVSISLSGENESVMGYMKDLLTMLGIAVLFIFLIMVAQFQSFKSPIIVMFTIPLAFTGGLLALIITGMDLSIIAMVGFLVLSGVVVNNGIVFIDSVNQMRISGMEKREALLETGRIRLRPILMTALTTILGMSTMAMAQGMGAEMMQPMAVVTIGGLSYATLMTLFVVPVLYDLLNGKTMKAREIEMIKEAAGMHREGFDDEAPVAPGSNRGMEPAPEPAPAWGTAYAEEAAPEPAPVWYSTPAEEPAPEPAPTWGATPAEEPAPKPAPVWGATPAEEPAPEPAPVWGATPAETPAPEPAPTENAATDAAPAPEEAAAAEPVVPWFERPEPAPAAPAKPVKPLRVHLGKPKKRK